MTKLCPNIIWPVEKLPCQLLGIEPSPRTEGYRNKCEFSAGINSNGEAVWGFQSGRFVQGFATVEECESCLNIPEISKSIARNMTKLIRESIKGVHVPPYTKDTHEGFWRLVTVRNAESTKQVMVIVQTSSKPPVGVTVAEIQEIVKDHFKNSELLENYQLVNICWQIFDGLSNAAPADCPISVLIGPEKPIIVEKVLGLK